MGTFILIPFLRRKLKPPQVKERFFQSKDFDKKPSFHWKRNSKKPNKKQKARQSPKELQKGAPIQQNQINITMGHKLSPLPNILA
uniref:Uncharacterized protein n=1 Tax=Cucumis melo TaxID=3656 RepID=A0A9I9EKP6_CUCME